MPTKGALAGGKEPGLFGRGIHSTLIAVLVDLRFNVLMSVSTFSRAVSSAFKKAARSCTTWSMSALAFDAWPKVFCSSAARQWIGQGRQRGDFARFANQPAMADDFRPEPRDLIGILTSRPKRLGRKLGREPAKNTQCDRDEGPEPAIATMTLRGTDLPVAKLGEASDTWVMKLPAHATSAKVSVTGPSLPGSTDFAATSAVTVPGTWRGLQAGRADDQSRPDR